MAKRKGSKNKSKWGIPRVDKKINEQLKAISESSKKKEITNYPKPDIDLDKIVDSDVDVVTGDAYEPLVSKEKASGTEEQSTKKGTEEKEKKGKSFWPIFKETEKKDTVRRVFERVKDVDVTVACIEVPESLDKFQKAIQACLVYYKTDYFKFVFFKNSIYSTEIIKKTMLSDGRIAQIYNSLKEIAKTLGNDNVLLYDAMDEAFVLDKEESYFKKKRRLDFGEKEQKTYRLFEEKIIYEIRNVKYLFVISGNEKGSDIAKEELQKIIFARQIEKKIEVTAIESQKEKLYSPNIRKQEVELQVILTDKNNLVQIASLGVRSIKV